MNAKPTPWIALPGGVYPDINRTEAAKILRAARKRTLPESRPRLLLGFLGTWFLGFNLTLHTLHADASTQLPRYRKAANRNTQPL